jgi:hypothetical protein
LLQCEEQGRGAGGIHAIVGEGVHDFPQCDLKVLLCLELREVEAKSVSAAAVLSELALSRLLRVVEVTESLIAKSGRTTKKTIRHAMVAGRTRHLRLQKTGLSVSN